MKKIVRKRVPRQVTPRLFYYLCLPFIAVARSCAEFFVCLYWLTVILLMNTTNLYWQSVSRNIGWIRKTDQEMLKKCVVGVAGCGGMGGHVIVALVRLGIGEIRIADNEPFDFSNLNRQYGATLRTVGLNKAIVMGRVLGMLSRTTKILVYPEGICKETVAEFCKGCDAICDEIELWAMSARILLHKQARGNGVPILCAPTVGFCVYVFLFTPGSMSVEEIWENMSYEEAEFLQKKMRAKTLSEEERERVLTLVLRYAAPEGLPEYSADLDSYSTAQSVEKRLRSEGTASILGSNALMSAGVLADQVLIFLLQTKSTLSWNFTELAPRPAFGKFDASRLPIYESARQTHA